MTAILADVYISPIEQFLGMLIVSHFLFPFVFIEAVTSAYVEQKFYRDILPNRSDRLAKTLRANCGAAVIGVLLSFLGGPLERILRLVPRNIPNSLEIFFWLLFGAGVFAVPVSIEALLWKRWSGRKLWGRVLLGNFVSGVVCFATAAFIRWLREHLPQTLEWKLRRFHGNVFEYMTPISWSCLAILILAWFWPLPKQSINVVTAVEVGSAQSPQNQR